MKPVIKLTIPKRNLILEQVQLIDHLPGTDGRKDRIRYTEEILKTIQMLMFKLQPKLKLETPRLHSGAAYDKPETIKIAELSSLPDVVWHQPAKKFINQYNLKIIIIDSTLQYTQETQMTTVASQISPPWAFNHRTT